MSFFDDAARPTGELALHGDGGALVLGADEIEPSDAAQLD
jgi:hypothetical protein